MRELMGQLPCGVEHPLEVSISLVLVELELERFHACYDTSVLRLNQSSLSLISPFRRWGFTLHLRNTCL